MCPKKLLWLNAKFFKRGSPIAHRLLSHPSPPSQNLKNVVYTRGGDIFVRARFLK